MTDNLFTNYKLKDFKVNNHGMLFPDVVDKRKSFKTLKCEMPNCNRRLYQKLDIKNMKKSNIWYCKSKKHEWYQIKII